MIFKGVYRVACVEPCPNARDGRQMISLERVDVDSRPDHQTDDWAEPFRFVSRDAELLACFAEGVNVTIEVQR